MYYMLNLILQNYLSCIIMIKMTKCSILALFFVFVSIEMIGTEVISQNEAQKYSTASLYSFQRSKQKEGSI